MTSNQSQKPRGTFFLRGPVQDAVLALFILVTGLILLQAGVFTVDESHYLLAANSMARDGSFNIDNGYASHADEALLFFYTVAPDKVREIGSVSTVPPYHAILAVPFLLVGGLLGLFLLNLVSFAATTIAVRRLASLVRPEGYFAFVCASVFVLGSFGFEYALGIWPHSLSQALVAWCVFLLLKAVRSNDRDSLSLAFLAGLLGAVATGVRLQNIVLLPILVLAARLVLKTRWITLLIHVAGWLPPLLGMALINLRRLGTANPLTYGWSGTWKWSIYGQAFTWIGNNLWALLPALVVMGLAVWLVKKRRFKAMAVVGGVILLAGLIITPSLLGILQRWLSMLAYQMLDSAFLPVEEIAAGSGTNELGQVLYGGILKKGLLEVAPFVVLCLLSVAAWARRIEIPESLGFVSLVSLTGLLGLPLVLSAGGFCYNPRYLLELMPAVIVPASYWAFSLRPPRTVILSGILAGCLGALPCLINPGSVADPDGGWFPALFPLTMAGLLLVCTVLSQVLKSGVVRLLRPLAGGLALAALAYGIMVQAGVDMKTSLTARHYSARILEEASSEVPDGSLLLAWESYVNVFVPLKLDRDVWLATLGSSRPVPTGMIEESLATRRVIILRNGIPDVDWDSMTRNRVTRKREKRGLVFVELGMGGDSR